MMMIEELEVEKGAGYAGKRRLFFGGKRENCRKEKCVDAET